MTRDYGGGAQPWLATPTRCRVCGKPNGGHDYDCVHFKAYEPSGANGSIEGDEGRASTPASCESVPSSDLDSQLLASPDCADDAEADAVRQAERTAQATREVPRCIDCGSPSHLRLCDRCFVIVKL